MTTSAPSPLLERVEALAQHLRDQPGDPDNSRREVELIQRRHDAFSELAAQAAAAPGELPPAGPVTPPDSSVTVDDLVLTDRSAQGLRTAFLTHGAALLPAEIGPDDVAMLVGGIDRAFEAFDSSRAGQRTADLAPWFTPYNPAGFTDEGKARGWNRDGGGIWTTDSPRNHFRLVEALTASGVIGLIGDYFGERPALSIDKSTLRRVPHDARTGDWHQDGAFLGPDIRTVNVWLALTDCGIDAPGLDIVPRRMGLAETGTPGAHFDWAVSPDVVRDVAPPVPVLRPQFRAGDILLFDHFFLHRTAGEPDAMTRDRYAVETWFFAPSCYPDTQMPITV